MEVVCYLCARRYLIQKESDFDIFQLRPICQSCKDDHKLTSKEDTSGFIAELQKRTKEEWYGPPREERITEEVKTLGKTLVFEDGDCVVVSDDFKALFLKSIQGTENSWRMPITNENEGDLK